MRLLLCPDSFKGSLSSLDVTRAMTDGIHRQWPDALIDCRPMADGGEGMAAIVTADLGGAWHQTRVHGPHGRQVHAGWGHDRGRNQAVVEVAAACGLDLLTTDDPDIWHRDTRGIGELILAALDAGVQRIIIGLGGSGTNDAGVGMLAALGVRFLDTDDAPLPPNPAALAALDRVDFSQIDARLAATELVVLTDVDNPLNGAQGASTIFGPQKGLAKDQIEEMDTRIRSIAERIRSQSPSCGPLDQPGTGAAGGLGFALISVLGATRHVGSQYIADLIGLDAAIGAADLVITGEGNLDGQTSRGKVVSEVVRRATAQGKPVIAIAGGVQCTPEEIHAMGLTAALSLTNAEISVPEAMARSGELIAERTKQAIESWLRSNLR